MLIQLSVLWWLRSFEGLGKLRAPAVAFECAIVNNFLWNELWTFRDRTHLSRRLRDRFQRFASFNVVCGVGAALQLGMVWLLAIRLRWPYLFTNLLAIGVVTLWNYGLNTTWTWTKNFSETRAKHATIASS